MRNNFARFIATIYATGVAKMPNSKLPALAISNVNHRRSILHSRILAGSFGPLAIWLGNALTSPKKYTGCIFYRKIARIW